MPAVPVDQRRPGDTDDGQAHEQPAAGHGLLYAEVHDVAVVPGEGPGVRVRLAEDLGQDDPANVQPLLHEGDQVCPVLLSLHREPTAHLTYEPRGQVECGDDGDGQERQPGRHGEDDDDGRHECQHVAHDTDDGTGRDLLDGPDVVVDARDDLARTRRGVEAQRLLLQAMVELVAQIEQDALAHARVEVVLQYANEAADNGEANDRADEQV